MLSLYYFLKQKLMQYYRYIFPVLFSCIFLFSGSLNVKVYANEITQPKFNSYYPNTESMNFEFFYSSGATGQVRSTRYNDWSFYFTNSDLANGLPNVSRVGFYFVADGWTNPVNTELYDYYLFINLFSQRDTSSSSSNYVPSDLIVKSGFYSDGVWNDEYTYPISDLEIIYSAGGQSGYPYGYNITAKIDMSERNTIGAIYVPFVNRSYIKGSFNAAFFILEVEKGYNESFNNIIAAINNQTDSIMNSGSGFGGTTSGIISGNSELNDYINQYTQIEQNMHDKFVETQMALNGNFTGFSWGSLSTCLNWVSDYLQQIYLNSGDFKMMITLPLLLGIALFLIGRGSLVYGEMTRDKGSDIVNKDLDFTLKD